jgi:hypothetical protein
MALVPRHKTDLEHAMSWKKQQRLICGICCCRIVDVPGSDGDRFEFFFWNKKYCCKACLTEDQRERATDVFIQSKDNPSIAYESGNNCLCPECVWCLKHLRQFEYSDCMKSC